MRWNPWRALRALPHIELWFAILPGTLGEWHVDEDGEVIVIDARLDRRERRAVLAHELIHAERRIGHPVATAATMEREEAAVRQEVARRLVPSDELAAFIARRLTAGPVELHDVIEEFDVPADVAELACRQVRCSSG